MELHRPFAVWLLFLGIGIYCQGEPQFQSSRLFRVDKWITRGTNDDQRTDVSPRSSARSEARSESSSSSMSTSKGDREPLNDDNDILNNEFIDMVRIRTKRTPKGGGGGGKGGGGKGGGGKGGGGKGGGGKGGGGKGGGGKGDKGGKGGGKGGLSKDELEAIKKAADAAKAAAEAKKQEEENKKNAGQP